MKTPHELACAISALINSQPRSPTVAELEGVIGEHWEAPSEIVGLEALQGEGVAVTDDLREITDGVSNFRRLARVERQTDEERDQYLAALSDFLECKRKEDPAGFSRGEFLPPLTVVVEPMRDNFFFGAGGVTLVDGSPPKHGAVWFPPERFDPAVGD